MSAYEFILPDVGEGLADAEILRWVVPVGGQARRMQPLVEVETAKSAVEIPSPVDGVVLEHGADEGTVLEVGALLARIETADAAVAATTPSEESPPPEQTPAAAPSQAAQPAQRTQPAQPGEPAQQTRKRVAAAPTVRRLAVELGVDLTQVTGSGPNGRVLADDVRAFANGAVGAPPAAPAEPVTSVSVGTPTAPPLAGTTEQLSPARKAIAGTLTNAWSQVPLITDLRDVDVTRLVEARATLRSSMFEHLTYTTLFAAAAIAALRRHPVFNASIDVKAGTVTYHPHIHLGIAVSVPGGLSVAVIREAEKLRLADLGERVASLAASARDGKLSAQESSGATFTVSSFGQYGGWYGTPLVVPPQVAIAGFGPIKDRVIPVDGEPAVRPVLPLSISVDHRLIDGAELSTFSSDLEAILSDPILLLGA